MTDLSALIDLLEKATEGSRELDARIAICADLVPPHEYGLAEEYEYAYEIVEDYGKPFVQRRARDITTGKISDNNFHGRYTPPPYTTSVDSALSLIPDGWAWSIQKSSSTGSEVWLYPPNDVADIAITAEHWTSMPLAICIASLKARQSTLDSTLSAGEGD